MASVPRSTIRKRSRDVWAIVRSPLSLALAFGAFNYGMYAMQARVAPSPDPTLDLMFAERAQLLWGAFVALVLLRLVSNCLAAWYRARGSHAGSLPARAGGGHAQPASARWNDRLMRWLHAREQRSDGGLRPTLRAALWYGLGAGLGVWASHVVLGTMDLREPSALVALITVIIAVGLLDTLPVAAGICFFSWPAKPGASGPRPRRPTGDTCLLIACHNTCTSPRDADRFASVLRAAVKLFPPQGIFICDNNSTLHPTDRTEQVAKSVARDINYLYVPEANKTLAFYWANRYWIPKVQRTRGEHPYECVMIMDDDVLLPESLTLDTAELKGDSKIKAIGFPMQPAVESGGLTWVQSMQAVEYTLSSVNLALQSQCGTALYAHGSVALWQREALSAVLRQHDTVFHGEDRYNAFMLFGMRQDFRIRYDTEVPVRTSAPRCFLDLWMQRVRSWDVGAVRLCRAVATELLFHWDR